MKIHIRKFETYCSEQLNLSEHTLRAYRQDLSAFVRFLTRCETPKAVNSATLLLYQRHLREEKSASPSTIRRRFVTLRCYFKWLEEENHITENPFNGLRLELKVPQRLPRPVDRPTLGALFKASKHLVELDPERPPCEPQQHSAEQVTGLMVRILVVTGMRISELTGLKVRDVTGACSQIRVQGKGNKQRTVYITNQRLLADFKCYWERRFKEGGSAVPLFLNSRHNPITPAAFRKRLRAISKSLLIEPYVTPHQFRHSAATLLIEEGVDIRIVQRLLGHASISTTEIYTKVSDNSLIAAIERADTLAQVDP